MWCRTVRSDAKHHYQTGPPLGSSDDAFYGASALFCFEVCLDWGPQPPELLAWAELVAGRSPPFATGYRAKCLRCLLDGQPKTCVANVLPIMPISRSPQLPAVPSETACLLGKTLFCAKFQRSKKKWCGRVDSNHHGIATASPSSWCVCQFRHDRTEVRHHCSRAPKFQQGALAA